MRKILEYLKEGEEGFSLLELVVAVGVIMVMTTGGVMAYGGVTDHARQAAVEKAASEVFTGASAFEVDSDSKTAAKDAETQWNKTSKKGENGDASIIVAVDDVDGCLVVTAKHVKGQEAQRQNAANCENTPAPGDENGDNNTPPADENSLEMVDADGNRYQINTTFENNGTFHQPNSGIRGNFKNINGLPEGITFHLSEWSTELPTFETHSGVEYVGTNDGMAEFLITDTSLDQFETWVSFYDVENVNRETYAEMWVELGSGSKFTEGQIPHSGYITESDRGRDLWVQTLNIEAGMVSSIPAPRLSQACQYSPGVLGMGSNVRIFWEVPEGYTATDIKVLASTNGAGSELAELQGLDLMRKTQGLGNNVYRTDVPTGLLGGSIGSSSELEIALLIEEPNGDRSEPAIIATNAGLIAGLGGTCRNVT